jgi:putative ABC transport system permease protein
VDEVSRVEGVSESAPLGYLSANTQGSAGEIRTAALLGYVPGSIAEPQVRQGRPLTDFDRRGILADVAFLKSSGLSIGDTLKIVNRLEEFEFTIVGEVDEGYFFFQPVVYLLLDSLREVKYRSADPQTPLASIVLIKGRDLTGMATPKYEIVSKRTAFANIEGVRGQQQTVNALRLFGFAIGGLVVGIFFYVLTLQKIQQIGLLKALGAGNLYLFGQLLLQVLAITLVGAAISAFMAYGTDAILEQLPQAVPISITTGTMILNAVLLVATALVGVLFSLRKVGRVDPMIAIGQQ